MIAEVYRRNINCTSAFSIICRILYQCFPIRSVEICLKLLLMVSFHKENLLRRFYCFEKRLKHVPALYGLLCLLIYFDLHCHVFIIVDLSTQGRIRLNGRVTSQLRNDVIKKLAFHFQLFIEMTSQEKTIALFVLQIQN